MFIFKQKIIFILPPLSLDNTAILQTCYFGYFGHLWPCPPKPIAPTCMKLWCLSANKKSAWSLSFFKRYYTLKNHAIWLVKNILGNNSRTRIFPNVEFALENQELKDLSFCIVFRKKQMTNFSCKIPNFLGPFHPNLGRKEFSTKSSSVTF